MIKSKLVKKNFSRSPDYYHQNAETQRYVASRLAEIIQQQSRTQAEKIMEIGCGTGFLTEKLLSLFPKAEFTITDTSVTMLQFCKNQTRIVCSQNKIAAEFILNDITKSCPDGKFDLIVSSLAFQWIDDLAATLQKIHDHLSVNGMAIFSTLSQGTFSSVKKVFNDLDIQFPGQKLYSSREIESACRNFLKVEITDESRIEEFNSILDFLHHIQGTGAGNASGNPLTVSNLKKILKYADKIPAEYNVSYAICVR